MVQDARRPSFLLEAAQPLRVLGKGSRQDLDRDVAPESRIFRPLHLSHATCADRREDLVGTQPGAGRQAHLRNRMTGKGYIVAPT